MKKLIFGLLLLSGSAASLSACKDKSKDPQPPVTSVPLLFPQVSADTTKQYFDAERSSASASRLAMLDNPTRPRFEFTFDVPSQRDVKIKAVEVYKSFRRGISGQIGPRVLVDSYTTFPATVSLNSLEAITGLQRVAAATATATSRLPTLRPVRNDAAARHDVFLGDVIIFTFEYVLQDDSRVILTPLTTVPLAPINGVAQSTQVISGTQINAPYSITARFLNDRPR